MTAFVLYQNSLDEIASLYLLREKNNDISFSTKLTEQKFNTIYMIGMFSKEIERQAKLNSNNLIQFSQKIDSDNSCCMCVWKHLIISSFVSPNEGVRDETPPPPWWVSYINDITMRKYEIKDSGNVSTFMHLLGMHRHIDVFSENIKSSRVFFETRGQEITKTIHCVVEDIIENTKYCKMFHERECYVVAMVESCILEQEISKILEKKVDVVIVYRLNADNSGFIARFTSSKDLTSLLKRLNGNIERKGITLNLTELYIGRDDVLNID